MSKDKGSCHKAREASERHISKKEGIEVFILEMTTGQVISKYLPRRDLSSIEF